MAGAGGGASGGLSAADVQTLVQSVAAAAIPQPATAIPPAAGTLGGLGGVTARFAREDHTHEVRARRKRVTLAAGTGAYAGMWVATWTFDKPFATKPIIVCAPEDDGGMAVFAEAIGASFAQNTAGLWISVMIRGWRAQKLPAVIGLLSTLAGYDPFGASAAGVIVGLTAAEETPVGA